MAKTPIKATLKKLLVAVEKETMQDPKSTEKLRSHTRDYGWPETIVSKLRRGHDGTAPTILYSSSVHQQIQDLEYGTPDTAPAPALRTFMMGDN